MYNNSDPMMEAQMFVAPQLAVRRLTPRECERLQGFTPRAVTYRVSACWADKSPENALAESLCTTARSSVLRVEDIVRLEHVQSAATVSRSAHLSNELRADVHVLIDCGAKKAVLRSAEKLLWSADIAEEQNKYLPFTLTESSVLRLAQALRAAAQTTRHGKVGRHQSETESTIPPHGSNFVGRYGATPAGVAPDAGQNIDLQNDFTKCITSTLGQKSLKSDSNDATWLYSAIHVIASFTHGPTPRAISFSLDVTVSAPHTLVPYRNKPAADGPRYKSIGNSMARPVMYWIGSRIKEQLDD